MDLLYTWLERHLPADDGRIALVHGDYRLDNLIFHKGKAEVQAVLDGNCLHLGTRLPILLTNACSCVFQKVWEKLMV